MNDLVVPNTRVVRRWGLHFKCFQMSRIHAKTRVLP